MFDKNIWLENPKIQSVILEKDEEGAVIHEYIFASSEKNTNEVVIHEYISRILSPEKWE